MHRLLVALAVLSLAPACTDGEDDAAPAPTRDRVLGWDQLLEELREVGVCAGYDCSLASELSTDRTSSAVIRSDVWAGGVGAPASDDPDAGDGVAACAVVLAAGYDAVQAWGDPDEHGWHLLAESGHTAGGCDLVAVGARP